MEQRISRRKFLIGLGLTGSAALLAACGGQPATTPTGGAATAAPAGGAAQDLKVIMISDPWDSTIKSISAEYPGGKVAVESYPYDQTHQKEVLIGTQKTADADVIVLDVPWVGEFAEGNFVEDLKPYIDKTPEMDWKDFIPSFAAAADWKGKIVGIPFAPYYILLEYRKDLFDQEGLKPPKTYDELMEIVKRFTKNPKYPGMYGISMNNAKGAPVGQAWFEYIWNFGGKPFASNVLGAPDPYADMTPLFNSKEGIAVVNMFKELLQYEPEGALNMAWDERAQAFASGKVAMIAEWSVRVPIFIDPARSQIADKFATAVIPAAAGVTPSPPLGGWMMSINAYSKNKDAAWEYIKWVNGKDVHKKFILAGGPPARTSELNDAELKAKFPWFENVAASAATAYFECRPRVPESFQIIDTVGNNISQALSGQLSVEDAMNKTNDEVRKLLLQGGYNLK